MPIRDLSDIETRSEASIPLSSAPATAVLDQLADELGITANSNPVTPRRRTHNNQTYIEIIIDRGRNRAWFWEHGKEWERQTGRGKKDIYWVCSHCGSFKPFHRAGSNHIVAHLQSVHRIRQEKAPKVLSVLEMQRHAPSQSHRPELSNIDNQQLLKSKWEAALVNWVTCDHLPFSVVESSFFQQLLTVCSDQIPALLNTSHNSLQSSIMSDFSKRRDRVKSWIHRRKSKKIHFSFDLWTSPNSLAMLAVIAHFVSEDGKVEAPLLALRSLHGIHSGENQAGVLTEIWEEYDISSTTVGCFILDNARNNDTCVQTIERLLKWPHNEWMQRRLRCWGHILNLAAQAFLFGVKDEIFEEALQHHQQDFKEDQIKLWKLQGPVGKLHYIIVYIRRTPQRRQAFKEIATDVETLHLAPVCDNATRWNSAFAMIKRACQIRENIDRFCRIYESRGPPKKNDDSLLSEQILNDDDWLILTNILQGLEIFQHACLRLQGQAKQAMYGSIWESIGVFEWLMRQLKDLQLRYPLDDTYDVTPICGRDPSTGFMHNALDCAFVKLRKYYDLTDYSVYYTAASILNPMLKWNYLEHTWRDEPLWLCEGRLKVKRLWQTYKDRFQECPSASSPPRRHPDRIDDEMFSWEGLTTMQMADEYEIYCSEPPLPRINNPDLIIMWQGLEARFPNLAMMAYDILSIPAMSAECERVFSSAKKLISDSRNGLSPASIEAVECNRHWLLHGYGIK